MKKIYIYSDSIRSGKTTSLFRWAAEQKNVKGILQPVINDKRFFYHIALKELRILETDCLNGNEIITIGKYHFSIKTFLWAQNLLLQDFNSKCNWLLIDEIGPLELNGKGLEPNLGIILNSCNNFAGNIVCVVRDSLVEQFLGRYQLFDSYQKFEL
jgi:nucleoside-triphosphatase